MHHLSLPRVGVSLALALFLWSAASSADPPRGVQAELGLAIAKVCANEAGFTSPADCDMIWQVVETHHSTGRRQLAWLRAHSRRVLGTRTCRGNCVWSRNLTRHPQKPAGWPVTARWRPDAWQTLLAQADALVAGQRDARPCSGEPVTWGGAMDRAGAIRRGLIPLTCEGTRNQGYARHVVDRSSIIYRVRVVGSRHRNNLVPRPAP